MKPGDAVINPRCPAWGQGKVIQIKEGSKARVFFLNEGEKTVLITNLDPSPYPLEAWLQKLDTQVDSDTPYFSFDSALKRFLELFLEGFEDPKYHREERDWKVKSHRAMLEKLNEDSFRKLVKSDQYDQIVEYALAAENTEWPLLSPQFEKAPLHDALKHLEARKQFSVALFDFLYGQEEMKQRFDRFLKMLTELPQPQSKLGKWPVLTLFLFLRYPKQYIFLKPAITLKAAQRLRYDIQYRSEPNWGTYSDVLEFAKLIKELLIKAGHPPKDMIDVQSFIYAIERY